MRIPFLLVAASAGVVGCAPAAPSKARIRLELGNLKSSGGSLAIDPTALETCPADLTAYVHAGDADIRAKFSTALFDWTKFFDSTNTESLLDASTGAELEVTPNVEWNLSVAGAVVIGTASTSSPVYLSDSRYANLNNLRSALDSTGGGFFDTEAVPTLTSGTWNCGSLDAWTSDNAWEPFLDRYNHVGSSAQIVVPLTGPDQSALNLSAGETARLSVTVTAARVPFGAYTSDTLGLAGFLDGSQTSPTETAMAPFGAVQVESLDARLDLSAANPEYIDVIPVLKDLQSESQAAWRGMADGNLDVYNMDGYTMTLFPIPPNHQYRVGVVLKCGNASGCGSVGFNKVDTAADPADVVTAVWPDQAALCLWKDVTLHAISDTTENFPHLLEVTAQSVTLQSNGWGITTLTDDAGSGLGPLDGSAVTSIAPDGCAAKFFSQ